MTRLEPMDSDREDRHVSEDEDRFELRRQQADPEPRLPLEDWNARDDADLGMTRGEHSEIRKARLLRALDRLTELPGLDISLEEAKRIYREERR